MDLDGAPEGPTLVREESMTSDGLDEALAGPSGAAAPQHGPVCSYGSRLCYTYFPSPVPSADTLNEAANGSTYWFTIDAQLIYLSFFQDTGPLNVAMFYRFSLHLHALLEDKALAGKNIVLYSSDAADKKANAALLIALYAMVVMRWSPADALHPIACLELQPFRDAGYSRADFHLSVQDVLFGVKKAVDLRLLKLDEFDVREYETYEKVEAGDWNYVTPHFLAFASPVDPGYGTGSITSSLPPKLPKSFRNVLEHFKTHNIRLVIRLNKKLYSADTFTELGMEHREMYFDDGTNPTMEMTRLFIDIADKVIEDGGVVAVHCKAGLGRTGTLIGAYMIYKWGFTAAEAIGLMRIMRPGSVVGPQQHWLSTNQHTFVRWAAIDSVTRSSAPRSIADTSMIERPLTPPSDTDAPPVVPTSDAVAGPSNPPRTPRGPTNVPGQPRKTPGARTRHTVAAPEPEEGDAMEGVERSVHDSERELTPTDAISAAAAARPKANTAPRSTRSTAPKQRPASAITDSRTYRLRDHDEPPPALPLPVPKRAPAASGSDSAPSSVSRSKASRNLGTFLDDPPAPTERYNLRRDASGGRISGASATASASGASIARPASPSRLPQRVSASTRRRAASSKAAPLATVQFQANAGVDASIPASSGKAAAPSASTTKLTRSVRRRRSSMGATDIA